MTDVEGVEAAPPARIVQVVRQFGHGFGVGSVAASLEKEFIALGYETERLTLEDCGLSNSIESRSFALSKLKLMRNVVWFSIVGTWMVRRRYRKDPDVVVLTHGDPIYGDIFVNHGLLKKVMQDRGNGSLHIPRNPMHWFTLGRDEVRYRSGFHRFVVCLTADDRLILKDLYPSVNSQLVVVPNGIDLDAWSMPNAADRAEQRSRMGVDEDDHVMLFVGHEFERKGLWHVVEALALLPPRFRLVVVGGSAQLVDQAVARIASLPVADRVTFMGRVDQSGAIYAGADSLVLPTSYETGPLVLLEALASGVPALMTRTGIAPNLLEDEVNGCFVSQTAASVASGAELLDSVIQRDGRLAVAMRARASVAPYSWRGIAARYAAIVSTVHGARATKSPG